jgi:hypothetical protein
MLKGSLSAFDPKTGIDELHIRTFQCAKFEPVQTPALRIGGLYEAT